MSALHSGHSNYIYRQCRKKISWQTIFAVFENFRTNRTNPFQQTKNKNTSKNGCAKISTIETKKKVFPLFKHFTCICIFSIQRSRLQLKYTNCFEWTTYYRRNTNLHKVSLYQFLVAKETKSSNSVGKSTHACDAAISHASRTQTRTRTDQRWKGFLWSRAFQNIICKKAC